MSNFIDLTQEEKASYTDKPIFIDNKLSKILNLKEDEKYTQLTIFQLFKNYVKINGLLDPDNRNIILCNGPMYNLFHKVTLTFKDLDIAIHKYIEKQTNKN